MTLSPNTPITERQVAILQLIADGKRLRDVALVMKITLHTAKVYSQVIQAKLEAETLQHAVAIGIRDGIIE